MVRTAPRARSLSAPSPLHLHVANTWDGPHRALAAVARGGELLDERVATRGARYALRAAVLLGACLCVRGLGGPERDDPGEKLARLPESYVS